MKRRDFLKKTAGMAASGSVLPLLSRDARAAESPKAGKPNILFILVDDLGKEWLSCYGAELIETPNLDRLAAGGMRLQNAYSTPQCTPTRVTLLTGQYPFRHGWTNHWDVPRWGCGCHFDEKRNTSFSLVMRQAGYATAAAGKWQIDDFRVEPDAMHKAGFDEWCMWTGGEGGNPKSNKRYWDPYINTREGSRTYKGQFGPKIFNDFLIDFMKRHRDEPMFLYYPMALTHGPRTTTPAEPHAKGKMGQFKAMVRYTDHLVGRLVDTLDELEIREDTIVIFTTDNGTGGAITGRRNGHKVRGAKARMVEAGTAMPFIVNCPGRVPSGVVTDALTDFTDMLPTFAELGGGTLSEGRVVDGHSIAPLLLGETRDSPRDWIMAMGGHPAKFRNNRVVPAHGYDDRVVRDDRWKLWINHDREAWKLYDLKNDPWEEQNLVDSDSRDAIRARKRLMEIASQFPKEDAAPRYRPNPEQPWDKYDYEGPDT